MPLSLGYGALAGAALGLLLIGPGAITAHRLAPPTAAGWLGVVSFLAIVFAILGAMLGPYAAAPALLLGRRRPGAIADACVTSLPPLYLGLALLLEIATFGATVPLAEIAPWLAAWAGIVTVAVAVSRVRPIREPRRPGRVLALAIGLGAIGLPLGAPSPSPDTVPAPAALHASPAPPLLFVAIDGASWPLFDPLVAAGELPAFARLAREGTTGDVVSRHPPHWSAPAWAAIATGLPPEATGVGENLAASVAGVGDFEVPLALDPRTDPILLAEHALQRLGLLRLHYHERSALRAPPFWEVAEAAGLETVIVGLPFTHPPTPATGDVVVSNWTGEDLLTASGIELERDDGTRGVVPAAQRRFLLDRRASDGPALRELRAELRGSARVRTRATPIDPLSVLDVAAESDWRAVETVDRALALHPEARLVAVYLGGLDAVSHAFWPYRFPGEYADDPPPEDDVEALGAVLDRYCRFLDRALARLEARFAEPPNVLVVADHGFEPVRGHPLWRAWHAERGGVFLAAGPTVAPRARRSLVLPQHVAPRVLELLGLGPERLPQPPGMG